MKTRKIIIIDDDIRTRIAMEEVLENSGYTVECVRTGNEGIQRILKNGITIAIIDVRLPDMTGIEVLKVTKEHRPHICCIIVTAYPNVKDAVKTLKLGAYEYMEKPIELQLIVDVINKAVSENVIDCENSKYSTNKKEKSNV